MKLCKFTAAAFAAATIGLAGTASAVPVGLELSLVIDVSGSVNATEYSLQADGYRTAFLDAGVQSAILSFAGSGGIVVNVIQFSDNAAQAIGWTQLTTAAQITSFANQIGTMARLSAGGTDVEDGMSFAINALNTNNFEGARRVIDVSGDGEQNVDPACASQPATNTPGPGAACLVVQAQRDAAAAAGIRINGLAIEDGGYGTTGLTNWYNTNVRTSDGFVVTASNFADFSRAVTLKIGREIIGVPEPLSLALVGVAGVAAGVATRRQRA